MTDSILRSYQAYSFTSVVPFQSAAAAEGALLLLDGESQGFAIDATTYDAAAVYGGGTVAVIDTGTPANDLDNVALNNSNLTQSGTSAKIVQFPTAPFARWSPHNRIRGTTHVFESNWSLIGVTPDDNATTAPDGTSTGCLITVNGANNRLNGFTLGNFSVADGDVLTCSVYAKVGSGTNYMLLRWAQDANNVGQWFNISTGTLGTAEADGGFFVGSNRTIVDAGGGWWRCSFTVTASGGGASGPNLQIWAPDADNSTTTTSGRTQYVWGPQIIRGYSAGTFTAHGAVNADVIGIPQSYDAAAVQYGMLLEPAATNLALYSDDFTNAAWTKSNMSTAKTATGPDNGTNSATTLTASAGNATALQAITSASSLRMSSFWVKRRTGSGNIDLTQDNGSTWQTMTVTSDWTRVNLTAATLTNPTVGIRIVTNTDAIDVWGFQHETANDSPTAPTSTIPTLGTTVTRAIDVVKALSSSVPTLSPAVSGWAKAAYFRIALGEYLYAQVKDADEYILVLNAGGGNARLFVSDTTTQATPILSVAYVVGQAHYFAWSAEANSFNIAHDGTVATRDVSGSMPSGFIDIFLGGAGVAGAGLQAPMMIFYMALLPRTMDDTEIDTKSTP